MKKIYLCLLVVLCLYELKGQEYTPLLDNFNEWHVTYCYFGCLTDIYYTDGDTVVNGKTHKILDGYHYISRTLLLREDIEEKKVYFTRVISPNDSDEYLVYDFSVEEGDSIQMLNPITPFPEDGGYFLLDSIVNRPLVDGENYRHYYFTPTESNTISTHNAVWVEGVGSLSLINAPGGDPDINGVGQLSCFFKEGSLFYSNLDSIDGCEPLLSVNDIKQPQQEVVLTYRDDERKIVLHHTQDIRVVRLYTLSGKLIESSVHLNQAVIEINLESFNSGVYLCIVENSKGSRQVLKISIN